jgi:cell wall-associated NlpC family hydrolase
MIEEQEIGSRRGAEKQGGAKTSHLRRSPSSSLADRRGAGVPSILPAAADHTFAPPLPSAPLREPLAVSRGTLVAAQAELWVGVPFHWQGRVRAGCDCKGLVAGVAAELGFPEADSLEALVADYGDVVPAAQLRAGLAAVFDRVPMTLRQAQGDRTGIEPGDILLCRVHGRAQHLAIAAPREFSPSRVIEALLDARQVRPFKRPVDSVDSAWRWKEAPTESLSSACGGVDTDRTNVRPSGSMPPVGRVPDRLG